MQCSKSLRRDNRRTATCHRPHLSSYNGLPLVHWGDSMTLPTRRIRLAAVCCGIAGLATQADAQQAAPLALSYGLEARAEAAKPAPSLVTRCTGVTWMAALNACGRELLARIAPVGEVITRAVVTSSDAPPTGWMVMGIAPAEPAATRSDFDLPALGATGAPAESRYVRSAGGREALIGSSRTADLLLRLGSKHRFKNNEEGGWDMYRFNDTGYQTHLQTNGHKALGVELLVPFQ